MLRSDNISIIKVPRHLLPQMWLAALPFLEKGFAVATDCNHAQVSRELVEDLAQLWIVFSYSDVQGAFLTSIYNDEQYGGKMLFIYGLGGKNMPSWAEHANNITHAFAKHNNCSRCCFYGRKSWGRILRNYSISGNNGKHPMFERIV